MVSILLDLYYINVLRSHCYHFPPSQSVRFLTSSSVTFFVSRFIHSLLRYVDNVYCYLETISIRANFLVNLNILLFATYSVVLVARIQRRQLYLQQDGSYISRVQQIEDCVHDTALGIRPLGLAWQRLTLYRRI